MRLIFIRHAEPDYSIDSLTEKGWREAKLLAERTKRWKVDEFYCSPLGRAKDTASFTLKECGREAVTCDWMREFDACVVDPETGKNRLSWDLKPAYWTKEPDLLNIDRFLETDLMKSGPVAETYQKVCDGLDGILAKHGYHREGRLYRTKQHNEDTIVLFCHMGVTFYMLSHLLSISPVCLNHTMFLPPSSVTVVSTEEVEQKQAQIMWQTRLTRLICTAPGSRCPTWDILRRFCRSVRYDRSAASRLCYAAICSASDCGYRAPYSTDACTLSFSGRRA